MVVITIPMISHYGVMWLKFGEDAENVELWKMITSRPLCAGGQLLYISKPRPLMEYGLILGLRSAT